MKIANIKKLLIVASSLLVLLSTFSLAAKHRSNNLESMQNKNKNRESVLSAMMAPEEKKDDPVLSKEVPKPLVKPITASPIKKANPVKKANPIGKLGMFGKPKRAPGKKGKLKGSFVLFFLNETLFI